jgi:TrmH family RNA methyltransferase
MKIRSITSPSNSLIKRTAEIASGSRRADQSLFIAEGPHLVEAALNASWEIKDIFFTTAYGKGTEGKRLLRRLAASGSAPAELTEVPDNVFMKISDTGSPQGILAVVPARETAMPLARPRRNALLAVCDGISDPGNLGTIIRVADASGSDAVVLLPGCCDPFSSKVVRSTAGSIFNLPLVKAGYGEFGEGLTSGGIRLFVSDVRAGLSIYDADLTVPCALAFGNESRGASERLLAMADRTIKIPMAGRAESLNAAVSAAVCLYEAVRQRGRAG